MVLATSVLKPVSTRSALLTLLLGADVTSMSSGELAAAASVIGFAEPTVRVALSRMASAGDVVRDGEGQYRLSDRLLERQRRQERAAHPALRTADGSWDGSWDVVVVSTLGRTAADRAELRATLSGLRLAELREGVWTRPANLEPEWPASVAAVCDRFTSASVDDSAALAGRLWDLDTWSATAHALLDATATEDPVLRFTACATSGRHLLEDPVLPPALLPPDWPGEELRASHVAYKQWIVDMRHTLAPRD